MDDHSACVFTVRDIICGLLNAAAVAADLGTAEYLDSVVNATDGHDPALIAVTVNDGDGCDVDLSDLGDRTIVVENVGDIPCNRGRLDLDRYGIYAVGITVVP